MKLKLKLQLQMEMEMEMEMEMHTEQTDLRLWVRWGYVAIEWSRWTWKAWKKSTTTTRCLLDLSKHIQISCQNWHRQPSCGLQAWETDRQADRQTGRQTERLTVSGSSWRCLQCLRHITTVASIFMTSSQHKKNSSKHCQNKYDVINEQRVAFRHWLKPFFSLPARQQLPKLPKLPKLPSCQSCWQLPNDIFGYLQKCELYLLKHANSFATSRAELKHFGGCQKTSRETLLSQMHSISVIIKHPLAAKIT